MTITRHYIDAGIFIINLSIIYFPFEVNYEYNDFIIIDVIYHNTINNAS